MGGSGSGGYFSQDPFKVRRELAAQSAARNEQYEAEANDSLRQLLGNINNRNSEAISRRLQQVKDILDEELDGFILLRFGGSVAKHTYVDGFSDVDSLVLLDNCELAEESPSEAKEYLAYRLEEELTGARVRQGRLAVTVEFPDVELQLLPAISCRGAVQIADPMSDDWARIRPREFTRALTEVNAACAQKVVPVIKLAKAIIASFPEKTRLSGYHTEALAVKIFREYNGAATHKSMLRHFFEQSVAAVKSPIRDRTGQSIHVDEYLGREGSLERRIVSDNLSRIARRMAMADAAESAEQWTQLFGD
jgi:hypothetical protein